MGKGACLLAACILACLATCDANAARINALPASMEVLPPASMEVLPPASMPALPGSMPALPASMAALPASMAALPASMEALPDSMEVLSRRIEVLPGKMTVYTGGLSAIKIPTADIQAMVASLKPVAETRIGRAFPIFNAIAFKQQVVTGINYFVKVHVGGASYIHVKIHRSPAGQVQLISWQTGLTRMSPIAFI